MELSRSEYWSSHKGSPSILEWAAYPFSSIVSWSRIWIRVSCIAGGFFTYWASLVAQLVKDSSAMWETRGLIPGFGRSPGEGKRYPLQYSALENSKDCIVHAVVNSQTQLSDFHTLYRLSYLLGMRNISREEGWERNDRQEGKEEDWWARMGYLVPKLKVDGLSN